MIKLYSKINCGLGPIEREQSITHCGKSPEGPFVLSCSPLGQKVSVRP